MYTRNDITVVPDFINRGYQETLERFLLGADFPVYRDAGTAVATDQLERVTRDMPMWKDDYTREHPQFIHSFVHTGEIVSQIWPRVAPLWFELERQLDRDCRPLRVKLNVNVQDNSFGPLDHYPAHIDVAQKDCVTAIYYVNNSDGDTIWFDDDMKEIFRLTPKRGTLVYFPCRMRHCGQPPRQHQMRAVINFNAKLTDRVNTQ